MDIRFQQLHLIGLNEGHMLVQDGLVCETPLVTRAVVPQGSQRGFHVPIPSEIHIHSAIDPAISCCAHDNVVVVAVYVVFPTRTYELNPRSVWYGKTEHVILFYIGDIVDVQIWRTLRSHGFSTGIVLCLFFVWREMEVGSEIEIRSRVLDGRFWHDTVRAVEEPHR